MLQQTSSQCLPMWVERRLLGDDSGRTARSAPLAGLSRPSPAVRNYQLARGLDFVGKQATRRRESALLDPRLCSGVRGRGGARSGTGVPKQAAANASRALAGAGASPSWRGCRISKRPALSAPRSCRGSCQQHMRAASRLCREELLLAKPVPTPPPPQPAQSLTLPFPES